MSLSVCVIGKIENINRRWGTTVYHPHKTIKAVATIDFCSSTWYLIGAVVATADTIVGSAAAKFIAKNELFRWSVNTIAMANTSGIHFNCASLQIQIHLQFDSNKNVRGQNGWM